MAVPYFVTPRVTGPNASAPNQSIYAQSSTQEAAVGFRMTFGDDRVYRYSGPCASAITQGHTVSRDLSVTDVVDSDNVILPPASSVNTDDGKIGSTHIEITLASVTAGQYKGAIISLSDDTGEGYQYYIKDNTATNDPASGTIRLTLADPLVVAVDATTDFGIMGNPWTQVRPFTTTDTQLCGIAVCPITAAYYAWLQTWGRGTVLVDTTVAAHGNLVQASSDTTGSSNIRAVETVPIVGYCCFEGDNSGHQGVYLMICP